jgi:hypothetical protein
MPFCSECGNSVSPSDKFCRNCGGKQSPSAIDTMKTGITSKDVCRSCGSPLSPGLAVCTFCGATQNMVTSSLPPTNTIPVPKGNAPMPAIQQSTIRKCKACGNVINRGDKYCSKCLVLVTDPFPTAIPQTQLNSQKTPKSNAPLPAVQPSTIRKCKACGNVINRGEKFCSKCLVIVPELPPVEIPLDQLPPPPRQVFR